MMKRNPVSFALVISGLLLLCPSITAQRSDRGERRDPSEARALAEIRRKRPDIPERVLRADLALIERSRPEIANHHERWTAKEVRKAQLDAWEEVRLNSPLGANQPMNSAAYFEFVTEHMGYILFESDPDEAYVDIKGERLGSTNKDTNRCLYRTFPEGRTNTVVFSKPDFVSETKNCSAVARDTVKCSVTLKPKH